MESVPWSVPPAARLWRNCLRVVMSLSAALSVVPQGKRAWQWFLFSCPKDIDSLKSYASLAG